MSNPTRELKNGVVLGLITDKEINKRVVDIGVGSVNHSQFEELYLFTKYKYDKVVGIDAFQKNVDERNNLYANNEDYKNNGEFSFVCCDALDFDYEAEKPDVITLFHVIEHLDVESAKKLLLKLRDVSTVKLIIVETPDEFEDGSGQAKIENNEYQRHKSLIDEGFMLKLGFTKYYGYTQHMSHFHNSIYIFKK